MRWDVSSQALVEARSWIGTPYRHQASAKGAGADCLGLIRGVWRALYGGDAETPQPYSPDWAEQGGGEALLGAARRWMIEIPAAAAGPGDVLLFRFGPGVPAKHCALQSGAERMIHAWQGHAVCETAIGPWWRRRSAGAFRFPPQRED